MAAAPPNTSAQIRIWNFDNGGENLSVDFTTPYCWQYSGSWFHRDNQCPRHYLLLRRSEEPRRLLSLISSGQGGEWRESLWPRWRDSRAEWLENMSAQHQAGKTQAGNMGNQQTFTSGTEKPSWEKNHKPPATRPAHRFTLLLGRVCGGVVRGS